MAGPTAIRCPSCHALAPASAAACPRCGATLDELATQIEELVTVADHALAQELDRFAKAAEVVKAAADRVLGELDATGRDLARVEARLLEEEADLTEFRKAVRRGGSTAVAAPRRPHPIAAPSLALAGLLAAAGMFLLPTARPAALIALLAALLAATLGVGLRNPAAQ